MISEIINPIHDLQKDVNEKGINWYFPGFKDTVLSLRDVPLKPEIESSGRRSCIVGTHGDKRYILKPSFREKVDSIEEEIKLIPEIRAKYQDKFGHPLQIENPIGGFSIEEYQRGYVIYDEVANAMTKVRAEELNPEVKSKYREFIMQTFTRLQDELGILPKDLQALVVFDDQSNETFHFVIIDTEGWKRIRSMA